MGLDLLPERHLWIWGGSWDNCFAKPGKGCSTLSVLFGLALLLCIGGIPVKFLTFLIGKGTPGTWKSDFVSKQTDILELYSYYAFPIL